LFYSLGLLNIVVVHGPKRLMQVRSFTVRLMTKAVSVALLWLLAASVAEAAPGHRRADRAPLCDARTATIRNVMRRLKMLGGPVAHPRRARAGLLFDFTPRLHRTARKHVVDDRDAIQTDGALANVDPDDRAATGLRPVGVVIGSNDDHFATLAFSPRSPRGPPLPT
jgi:hypothetical protein